MYQREIQGNWHFQRDWFENGKREQTVVKKNCSREGTNNFSFTHVDFEVSMELQGTATYQLEKQVFEQTIVDCKIPNTYWTHERIQVFLDSTLTGHLNVQGEE